MFDANSSSLFLQRLGFFGGMALKRTTNSYKVWRDILNPEKMMDGEALTVAHLSVDAIELHCVTNMWSEVASIYWNGQFVGSLVKKN